MEHSILKTVSPTLISAKIWTEYQRNLNRSANHYTLSPCEVPFLYEIWGSDGFEDTDVSRPVSSAVQHVLVPNCVRAQKTNVDKFSC